MKHKRTGGAGMGADDAGSGSDFGASGPAPARKPAMAGGGKRGDMDDEIPF